MSFRAVVKWALVVALIFLPAATQAAPRARRPRGRTSPQHELDTKARKVALKDVSGKQVTAFVTTQSPGLAVLLLTNVSEEPLTVEVPLYLAAKPVLPLGGGNQTTNVASFGTTQVPCALAAVVSPQWSGVGVEKKRVRKSTRKSAKAQPEAGDEAAPDESPADDDAKPAARSRTRRPAKSAKPTDEPTDEKPAGEKPADEKANKNEKTDSTVAVVPLPAGAEQALSLTTLSVDLGKPEPRPAAIYEPMELEDATKEPLVKTLLEQMGQGKILDQSVAQILAWRYTSRKSWEELVTLRPIILPRIEAAKQLDDKLTGGKVEEK